MTFEFLAMRQPRILAERCVHSVCAEASCRACVAACPHQAWVFTADSLGLNTRTCDGCRRCEPACPTGAIGFVEPLAAAPGTWAGEKALYLHCEMSDVPVGAEGRVACLHSVDTGQLLAWSGQGVRTLVTCSGECGGCSRNRGAGATLATALAHAAVWLQSRDQAGVDLQPLDAVTWQQARVENPPRKRADPVVGRRGFFRFSVQAVTQEASKLSAAIQPETTEAQERVFTPPGRRFPLLKEELDTAVHVWVPELDAQRCTGCHACVRICPFAALIFVPAADEQEHHGEAPDTGRSGPAYGIDPAGCTGCALCRDVCEAGAVTLRPLVRQQHQSLKLRESRCRACGTVVYAPQTAPELPDGLCRICQRNNPYRNLFQVLP